MRIALAVYAASFFLLVAGRPALGIAVSPGASTDVPFVVPPCSLSKLDLPVSCASIGAAGLAQAGADEFFNGGVRTELYVDPGPGQRASATITFRQTLVNAGSQPEALLIQSVLLPGQVFVGGNAAVELFVGLRIIIDKMVVESIASQSIMFGDANGDTTWQNITAPLLTSGNWRSPRWAGVPSNWPQDGAVPNLVDLPFSVLSFDFNRLIDPGEQFTIQYQLTVGAERRSNASFVEFVSANIGDPLSLAPTALLQYDTSLFAPVPEPGAALLLGVAIAAVAVRSSKRRGRASP